MKTCKVEGCEAKHQARGYCAKHLYRLNKYGDPMKTSTIYNDPKKRIMSKVDIDKKTGCWIWNGQKTTNGYGRTTHKNKAISAHRLSYLVFNGDLGDGMCVCHKCDTPLCVNPDHLFLGTHKDNERDKMMKGRRPAPWNAGQTRQSSSIVDGMTEKARETKAIKYMLLCKDLYERKNRTGETYKQIAKDLNMSDRQLFDRYKKYERHINEKMQGTNTSL